MQIRGNEYPTCLTYELNNNNNNKPLLNGCIVFFSLVGGSYNTFLEYVRYFRDQSVDHMVFAPCLSTIARDVDINFLI